MTRLGWSPLGVLIIILFKWGTSRSTTEAEESNPLKIIAPASHVALSGDVTIFLVHSSDMASPTISAEVERQRMEDESNSDADIHGNVTVDADEEFSHDPFLRVSYVYNDISETIGEIFLRSLPNQHENVSIIVPCNYFSRGGVYALKLQYKFELVPAKFSVLEVNGIIDVKWPIPSLSVESERLATYPIQPVRTTIRYNGISCIPSPNIPAAVYVLQLIYCGSTVALCDPENESYTQVLYYEEVKLTIAQKVVALQCKYFGLPGNYAVRLKATDLHPNAPITNTYVKVEWSDEFTFDIHAKSIYPCEEAGGISVLFEYPSCRLQGDRVRVYGRLRADVASLAPPSTLHYVTELKAASGKHSLSFDCDIFTEKFIEYCFVYVSRAITGAMAEVKTACIPTFPLQESDAAGWGPWSEWSPCSSSCIGGIRNRYRFCDTPPPKYGAKFCQGKAVETESCESLTSVREDRSRIIPNCRHGTLFAATKPEIVEQIAVHCRCGCIITFQHESRKMLAANSQACPGRSFWLLQAQSNFVIRLHLDESQFPCPGQYLRARDGDSLNADLLLDIAFDKVSPPVGTIISTDQSLLLEFFSDELTAFGESCVGGFLAHAAAFRKQHFENGVLAIVPFHGNSTVIEKKWPFWKPAHLATLSFLLFILFVFIFLALQFVIKYRKYRIADDLDSISENSVCGESIQNTIERAKSTMTLLSDIASYVGLPRKGTPKHEKLKTTCNDGEKQYDSCETSAEYADEYSLSSNTLKLDDNLETSSEGTIKSAKLQTDDEFLSISNVLVVAQPEVKYARPVKLHTLGSMSTGMERSSMPCDAKPDSIGAKSINPMMIQHCEKVTALQSKDSPARSLTTAAGIRCGKETKDRRNRERLLQGSGSEFSLTNPDADLELDYYDYNVANASAVPGSYLGMDPTFLVWIPPLSSRNSELLCTENPDYFLDPVSRKNMTNSVLRLDTEGASLSPSEYMNMRMSGGMQGSTMLEAVSCNSLGRIQEGEGPETGEEVYEGKTMVVERLLPIHQLLEDSRVRVSAESLCGQMLKDKTVQRCAIPNRRESSMAKAVSPERIRLGNNASEIVDSTSKEEGRKERTTCGSRRKSREGNHGGSRSQTGQREGIVEEKKDVHADQEVSSCSYSLDQRSSLDETVVALEGKDKRFRGQREIDGSQVPSQCKYKEFAQSTQPSESNRMKDCVNIQMREFSESLLKPSSGIQSNNRLNSMETEESNLKCEPESIYSLLQDNQNSLRFVDDDDGDFIS